MANTHSIDYEAASSQRSFITDAAQTGLDLSGDFTLEGWFNHESTPSAGNLMTYIAKLVSTGNQRSYAWYLFNDSGTLRIQTNIDQTGDTSVRDIVRWAHTPTAGTWYHLALVCDISNSTATTFTLYVDTVSKGNGSAIISGNASSIFNSTAPFEIGADNNGGGNFFDGLANSVRVWGDIRTAQEIADNWKTTSPAGDNLLGHWYIGNNHNDQSGNGNNLTAANTPVFSTNVPFTEGNAALFFSQI